MKTQGKNQEIEKIGRVTSTSVLKCTGRGWAEWVKILNAAGAQNWPHQEIVAFLKKKYKLSLWWQQGVTGGYEIHIGRRVEGQNIKGEYLMTVTKVFNMSHKKLWKFLTSPEGLAIWLKPLSDFKVKAKNSFEVYGGVFGEVRTLKENRSLRMSWQETDWKKPTVLQIHLAPQSANKTILVIMHENLPSSALKEKLRGYWKGVLAELTSALQ